MHDLVGVVLVVVPDAEDADLLGGQPRRQRSGEVLDQDGEEPLDRAEQGAVEHDRSVAGVVRADVLELEPLGMVEVALDRAQLPGPADGVAHIDVDLRAVEGGVALLDLVGQAVAVERLAQGLGGLLPDLVGAHVLFRVLGRQVRRELGEPEGAQHAHDEVEERGDLVTELVLGAEDVAVVLGEAADPHHPVQGARPLVAVDGAELEQTQRQLAVAALAAVEDEAVHRAVHGLRVVRPVVHLHGRVHAVLVEAEWPDVSNRLALARCGVKTNS